MGLLSRLHTLFSRFGSHRYPWPALDITLPGQRHLHLVGSIHMGTPDMAPLPTRLVRKLREADALVVEADISGSDSPFSSHGEEPPLEQRLNQKTLEHILKLLQELNIPLENVDNLPLWQIALLLQAHQAQKLGLRPDYGIDYQLIQAASQFQRPVRELEGTDNQLTLLQTLPDAGLGLLQDTLIHWHTNARLLQTMISWWLKSPPAAPDPSLPSTFSNELYDVLMVQRNRQWYDFLHTLPSGHYVVAVGALHLYGESNLPSLLRQR